MIAGRLGVSFQRYPLPADGIVPDAPRSLGALPVAADAAGAPCVPVGDGEAVWLGLSPVAGREVEVRVTLRAASGEHVITPGGWVRVSERAVLERVTTAGGAAPLAIAREGPMPAHGIRFEVGSPGSVVAVDVRLLAPREFTAVTGEPDAGPLDPDAGYGGWRLP